MFAGNFGELNEISFILQHLCADDELVKLIYFKEKDGDPLSETLPSGVSNFDLVMYNGLYPYLRNTEISEEGANIYLNVFFGMSKAEQDSKDHKRNYLIVDVFVHQDLWKIETGIRTYEIMARVDKLLNKTKIPNVTEQLYFMEYRAMTNPNPKYSGFSMMYTKVDVDIANELDLW